jgi:hypothetical protein
LNWPHAERGRKWQFAAAAWRATGCRIKDGEAAKNAAGETPEIPVDAPKARAFVPRSSSGSVAQLVEQRTENPCVPGSIPG